jgi:hypothetical protein
VNGEFVTRHSTGASRSIRATCNSHRHLHVRQGCRTAATRPNAWQPLAFFSKKLNPAQQKYSAKDRELLAIHEAVKHFRHMLEARHFIIFIDHKPSSSKRGTDAHCGNLVIWTL